MHFLSSQAVGSMFVPPKLEACIYNTISCTLVVVYKNKIKNQDLKLFLTLKFSVKDSEIDNHAHGIQDKANKNLYFYSELEKLRK